MATETKGDKAVDRSSEGLQSLSETAARRGGIAGKLAQPLAEDAAFVRKLKPSLIKARAKGSAPKGGAPEHVDVQAVAQKREGTAPNPFAVIAGAAVAGFVIAKVVDWRGHAHPRD